MVLSVMHFTSATWWRISGKAQHLRLGFRDGIGPRFRAALAKLPAFAVVHINETGQASAAMAATILGAALTAKILQLVLASLADWLTQAARRR